MQPPTMPDLFSGRVDQVIFEVSDVLVAPDRAATGGNGVSKKLAGEAAHLQVARVGKARASSQSRVTRVRQ